MIGLGDLAGLVARMGALPDQVWSARVRAYRAQLALYGDYFLPQAYGRGDRFLLQHSAVHASLAAGRCALAQHRRLFRGQKYLAADLAGAARAARWLPGRLVAGRRPALAGYGSGPDRGDRRLVGPAVDRSMKPLSDFIAANELAWLNHTIPPEFW